MHASHVFGTWVIGTVHKRLKGCGDRCVEIDLGFSLFACRKGEFINRTMFNDHALFPIKHWREGHELIDGAIVLHLNYALVLLDETSFRNKGKVRHAESAQQLSFFLYVIDNFDLIIALGTIFESIVQNAAIEPSLIIEDVPLSIIVVFEWVCQVATVVQLCIVYDYFFWIVGDLHCAFRQILYGLLGIVRICQIEGIVWEGVFKYHNGYLVLSEHR